MAVKDLDAAFWPALRGAAAQLGVPASWLLLVFYLETRLQPHICNPLGYCGLNQMASSYLSGKGIAPAAYAAWPASQQVAQIIGPWYIDVVKNYLGKAPRSPGVLYGLNLAPGRVKSNGDAPGSVMFSNPEPGYVKNKGLDINGSGQITISDLDAYMTRLSGEAPFKEALAALGEPPSTSVTPAEDSASRYLWGIPLILGAAVGAAALIQHEHRPRRTRENPNPLTDKQLLWLGGGLLGLSGIAALAFAARGKAAGGSSNAHGAVTPAPAPIRSFPVDRSKGGVHYWDDFGQPRSNGRTHQGNDIFGPEGALVFAPNDGTVSFGVDKLGGPYFGLKTADGQYRYYGAHLSAFVDSAGSFIASSQTPPPPRQVRAGEAVGRVGHTGNAAGTPPHLHFQLWINGQTVDPYAYLKAAEAIA